MNDDPQILEDAMQAAAVLGAALARFQNSVDRLRKPSPGQIAQRAEEIHHDGSGFPMLPAGQIEAEVAADMHRLTQAVSVADPRHPVWNRYGTEGTDYDPDGPAGDSGG